MGDSETREDPLGRSSRLRRYADVREMIGDPDAPTPLVRLNRVARTVRSPFFVKLEWTNPFGSIKDRTAKAMLEGMERRGELEGKHLIEPTSGNTGLALAGLAALMGKKVVVTVPEDVSEEKLVQLRMLGAEAWVTLDDPHSDGFPRDAAITRAQEYVESDEHADSYAMPNQYENPDNVDAHYRTTGPEVWRQTEGLVRYFFAGFGTAGTVTGAGRFLKERDDRVCVVAIEPEPGHHIPGLRSFEESKTPSILDESVVDDVVRVGDEAAYEATARLFREEGLMVGPSTGAIVAGALDYLAAGDDGVAVAVSPDGGHRYASLFAAAFGD